MTDQGDKKATMEAKEAEFDLLEGTDAAAALPAGLLQLIRHYAAPSLGESRRADSISIVGCSRAFALALSLDCKQLYVAAEMPTVREERRPAVLSYSTSDYLRGPTWTPAPPKQAAIITSIAPCSDRSVLLLWTEGLSSGWSAIRRYAGVGDQKHTEHWDVAGPALRLCHVPGSTTVSVLTDQCIRQYSIEGGDCKPVCEVQMTSFFAYHDMALDRFGNYVVSTSKVEGLYRVSPAAVAKAAASNASREAKAAAAAGYSKAVLVPERLTSPRVPRDVENATPREDRLPLMPTGLFSPVGSSQVLVCVCCYDTNYSGALAVASSETGEAHGWLGLQRGGGRTHGWPLSAQTRAEQPGRMGSPVAVVADVFGPVFVLDNKLRIHVFS